LVALATRLTGELPEEVEGALVARQHRPTIERRLAAVLGNPVALRAGEVEMPRTSPLDWVGKITTGAVWPRLVQLREEALRLALPNVTTLVTAAMQRIDGLALAEVVRQQAQYAPAPWQEGQFLRAYEIERDTRPRNAQATAFDDILRRLRSATSLRLFKIWCEGPTDAPTIQAFVAKLPVANRLDAVNCSNGAQSAIASSRGSTQMPISSRSSIPSFTFEPVHRGTNQTAEDRAALSRVSMHLSRFLEPRS
jgi:hypothetical protein